MKPVLAGQMVRTRMIQMKCKIVDVIHFYDDEGLQTIQENKLHQPNHHYLSPSTIRIYFRTKQTPPLSYKETCDGHDSAQNLNKFLVFLNTQFNTNYWTISQQKLLSVVKKQQYTR
jgi:hypothetical protein